MRLRPSFLVVLLGAALGSCAFAPAGSDAATAIASMWREHIDAAKRKDTAAVLEIYAEDVVYVVGGQEQRGRAAMAVSEAEALRGADLIAAEHTTRGLHVIGDVAYEVGSVVGPVRPVGGEAQVVRFHFMATWRRGADGIWRIRHLVGDPE